MKSASKMTVNAILLMGFVIACSTSPTGRQQLKVVGQSEMAQMGAQSFAQIKKQQRVSKDPAVNSYVQCITDALVKAFKVKDAPKNLEVSVYEDAPERWEVRVFDDPSANAFALPGGYIGVHTGLLKVAQTPDQVAAVIGHEIGHVIADHGNERVSQNVLAQTGMSIASLVISGESQEGQLALAALGVGTQFGILLPYSRAHESEADILGIRYMAHAGFDPRASVELWKNMKKASGGAPPEFMSTHPNPDTRIERLEDEMSNSLKIYQNARNQGRSPNCRRP